MEHRVFGLRNFSVLVLVLSGLGLAGGYLGVLHPLGDSLSVGRVYAVVGVLAAAVMASLAGMQRTSFAALLLGLLSGLQVFMVSNLPGPPGRLVLYQKNLRFDNTLLPVLEADIRAAAPVLLTVQELSDANRVLMDNLSDLLPSQTRCPGESVGGTAVASQWPMVEGSAICAPGLAAMQVRPPESEPFWLVSIHLHWPYPYRQADHVAELLPVLAGLQGKVVLAGDFNMLRWGHSVRQIADAVRVEAAGPMIGTYTGFAPWALLGIDHVFAPQGGRVVARGRLGSDHLGLLAGLEL